MWAFDRIPKTEYKKAKKLWEAQDFVGLAILYNNYKVIPGGLCPSCGFLAVIKWTKYFIHEYIEPSEA